MNSMHMPMPNQNLYPNLNTNPYPYPNQYQYQYPNQYPNQYPYQYQYPNQYQVPYQNPYQVPNPSPIPSSVPSLTSASSVQTAPNVPTAPTAPKKQEDMDVKDKKKEIKEAMQAADEALTHLRKAKKFLNSANNWGLIDVFGGGFLSSALKQGNMCDARREINLSKDALKKLNDELKDINVKVEPLKTGGFLDFTDMFMDNMFSDIMVQTKIADTKNSCKKTIHDVERIKKDLEDRLQKLC